MKYAEDYDLMEAACADALAQIDDKRYDKAFADDRIKTIYKYGVACCKKECKVAIK